MKLREPDSARLIAAFGANIFYDEYCQTHVCYADHPMHDILDPDYADPPCVLEEIPTIRCKCGDRIPTIYVKEHMQEIHGGK